MAANRPKPLLHRFWIKVHKCGPDDCWEWQASTRHGYGAFAVSHGDVQQAHRFSWELHNGPIPDGLFACHRCDNRLCVNPNHLFLGTAADNNSDAAAKGRKPKGENHPAVHFSDEVVRAARTLRASGMTRLEVARHLGVQTWNVEAWTRKNPVRVSA